MQILCKYMYKLSMIRLVNNITIHVCKLLYLIGTHRFLKEIEYVIMFIYQTKVIFHSKIITSIKH